MKSKKYFVLYLYLKILASHIEKKKNNILKTTCKNEINNILHNLVYSDIFKTLKRKR